MVKGVRAPEGVRATS